MTPSQATRDLAQALAGYCHEGCVSDVARTALCAAWAPIIEAALIRAQRDAFEFAVAGGQDAGSKMMPRGMTPLVLYFATRADADALIALLTEANPNLVEHVIPERKP